MKIGKLYKAIADGKTILGVGPMSWNCIDATIEVANEFEVPMFLIASRRQVECESLGGGYVTTTEKLGEYVKEKDRGDWVFLARDHGGPWQGSDFDEPYGRAMSKAKESYRADIMAGFEVLHLDPSLKSRPLDEIITDIELLYEYCESVADGRELIYEAGTEEHGRIPQHLEDFEKFVKRVTLLSKIKFVVGNTGLYVREMQNTGRLKLKYTKALIDICNKNAVYLKGHNADYFSHEGYQLINEIGIHSINIAPELGVTETNIILKGLESAELQDRFIGMAVNSGKWKKWLRFGFESETYTDEYKARIAGHYIFNEFFKSLGDSPRVKGMIENFNSGIKGQLKDHIRYTLNALGWELQQEIIYSKRK